jgi:hypothetical protein
VDIRLGVFIGCLSLSIALAIFYWLYDSLFFSNNAQSIFSVNLNGNRSYQQDNLTLVIGSSRENASRSLSIFGISNQTSWIIFSSLLSGEIDRDISPTNILFNMETAYSFKAKKFPEIIQLSVPNLQTGQYSGWLYINGAEDYIVPITISTDAKIIQAVTVVVIGVLLSIAFWEIYFYFSAIVKRKNEEEIRIEANSIESQYLPAPAINAIAAVGPIPQDLINIQSEVQDLRNIADSKDASATKIENRYLENAAKIFTADVATVGFGILTGLIGLFSNNYVIGLIDLGTNDVIILIGIGLAIGSLKGLVDKPQ